MNNEENLRCKSRSPTQWTERNHPHPDFYLCLGLLFVPVGILTGKVGHMFMSRFETRFKTQFCTVPACQHLLCPSARPSLSPNPSLFSFIPIALISHLFHTSCKERVKYQGLLYSSLEKHWDPLPTDTGDSGVGREEKFEGFLSSSFLICAW